MRKSPEPRMNDASSTSTLKIIPLPIMPPCSGKNFFPANALHNVHVFRDKRPFSAGVSALKVFIKRSARRRVIIVQHPGACDAGNLFRESAFHCGSAAHYALLHAQDEKRERGEREHREKELKAVHGIITSDAAE